LKHSLQLTPNGLFPSPPFEAAHRSAVIKTSDHSHLAKSKLHHLAANIPAECEGGNEPSSAMRFITRRNGQRMATQGADYEREQMAFKGELRSRRLGLGLFYDGAGIAGVPSCGRLAFGPPASRRSRHSTGDARRRASRRASRRPVTLCFRRLIALAGLYHAALSTYVIRSASRDDLGCPLSP
jgi:hypothetical protein